MVQLLFFPVDVFYRHAKHGCADSMVNFTDPDMELSTEAKTRLMFIRMWHNNFVSTVTGLSECRISS